MVKKQETVILVIGAALLILAYFYLDTSDTMFGMITDKLSPLDWDEVLPRNIVKNSIPIELLETNGNSCKVSASSFDRVLDHEYFVRSDEVAEKLQFDELERTLIVPCDELQGEKSRLNVWYVVEESAVHSLKWEYFITAWDAETP